MTIADAQLFVGIVNEAALIALIDAAQVSVGTTVDSVGTFPSGTHWYTSEGEDGLRWIVTGIKDNGDRTLTCFSASDLDDNFGIGLNFPNIAGYINEDTLAMDLVPPYTDTVSRNIPRTATGSWQPRDPGSFYRGRFSVTKDAFVLTCSYLSAGQNAQGVIYLGRTDAAESVLYKSARAKVVSSVDQTGNVMRIELDRNINPALKDQTAPYAGDPIVQRLFVQSRITNGIAPNAIGFAMTERAAILIGTLTLSGGGNTQFDVDLDTNSVDLTAGRKLFAVGGRYDAAANPGVDLTNDIVSLCAEPTIAMCGSSFLGNDPFAVLSKAIISSWDAFGGQRGVIGNPLQVYLTNRKSLFEPQSDPERLSGRSAWYPLYVLMYPIVPLWPVTAIPQPAFEGIKLIGSLMPQLIMVVNQTGVTDNAKFKIDSDANRVYRVMERTLTGISPPNNMATDLCWAVGPGFI